MCSTSADIPVLYFMHWADESPRACEILGEYVMKVQDQLQLFYIPISVRTPLWLDPV